MPWIIKRSSRLKKGNNFNDDYSCSGAADNVQIQRAIDDANGVGGGEVFIQAGEYILDSALKLYDNVKIRGAGIDTVLKVKSGNTNNAIEGNSAEYAEVSNLTLHGNSNSAGDGLALSNNKFCRFTKLFIQNFGDDGVSCTPLGSNVFENNIFDGCEIHDNGGHGFNITAKDCIVANCYIYLNTGHGILLNDGGVGGWQFLNNHIYGNSVGVRMTGTTTDTENNLFVGNYIEFNTYDGMHLSDEIKNNVITGNIFWNNSRDTADTYDGIKIDSPNGGWAANNVITGNKFWQRHRYSISIDTSGSAPANIISGNDMEDDISHRDGVDLVSGNTGQAANIFDNRINFQELSNQPPAPNQSSQCIMYMKDDKLIIKYNDGGTTRYKYLDLTGTGVTWVHTTSAP
jgi:hypothetical protein